MSPQSRREKQETDKKWAEYQREQMYKALNAAKMKKELQLSNIPKPAPVKSLKDMSPASRQAYIDRQRKIDAAQSNKMEKIRDLAQIKTGLVKPVTKLVSVKSLSPKSRKRLLERRAVIEQKKLEAIEKMAARGKSKMLPPSDIRGKNLFFRVREKSFSSKSISFMLPWVSSRFSVEFPKYLSFVWSHNPGRWQYSLSCSCSATRLTNLSFP